jgi:hypothetical protein
VILVVPADTAVTRPVDEFTVATDVLLLLHDPPAVPLLVYVVVWPIQSGDVPLTVPADTFAFTVNACEALAEPQPPDTVYVIFVVPADTAVTTPVVELTVATDVLLLLHDPPAVPLLVYVVV